MRRHHNSLAVRNSQIGNSEKSRSARNHHCGPSFQNCYKLHCHSYKLQHDNDILATPELNPELNQSMKLVSVLYSMPGINRFMLMQKWCSLDVIIYTKNTYCKCYQIKVVYTYKHCICQYPTILCIALQQD